MRGKSIAYYRDPSDGPTNYHAIARTLDCADLDVEDVIIESINRIERAIERSPHDPGANYSLVERVEKVMGVL